MSMKKQFSKFFRKLSGSSSKSDSFNSTRTNSDVIEARGSATSTARVGSSPAPVQSPLHERENGVTKRASLGGSADLTPLQPTRRSALPGELSVTRSGLVSPPGGSDDFEELADVGPMAESEQEKQDEKMKDNSKNMETLMAELAQNAWAVPADHLEYIRKIGGGAFGVVFLGKKRGIPVAIKRLNDRDLLKQVDLNGGESTKPEGDRQLKPMRALVREVELMTRVRSPYVVMFLGVCLEPLACVTEYCANGSLFDLLQRATGDPELHTTLTWEKRIKMALHAALGCWNLHEDEIIHRDLKSPNLMVDDAFKVKVGDFGLSIFCPENGPSAGSSTIHDLNRRWMAPEVALALVSKNPPRQPFTKAADVYSFGLILLELMTFKIPFHDLGDPLVFFRMSQGQLRPRMPRAEEIVGGEFPGLSQYQELMEACWHPDPEARPGFEDIVKLITAILRTIKVGAAHNNSTASTSAAYSSSVSAQTAST